MIFATGRKRAASDPEGRVTGTLSAETRSRDQSVAAGDGRRPRPRRPATRASAPTRPARRSAPAARHPRPAAPPRSWSGPPVDEEELGISRRQFFNRGILVTMAISLGAFGAAAISFLYAKSAGGFGGKIDAGISLTDAIAYNVDKKEPYYVPEARSYLVPYPKTAVPKAKKVPAVRAGAARDGRGDRRPLPEVRAPRLQGARGARRRSGSSARATVRSTTGSARSRVARRLVGSTASS